MNKYGELAMRMVRDFDPQRWEAMAEESRETFFSTLGDQIHDQVMNLEDQVAGPDLPGETFLEKVGRLNAAKMTAEEIVLKELVYDQLPSEEDEEDLEPPELTGFAELIAERVRLGQE